MARTEPVTVSVREITRRFGYYSELSLKIPVIIARSGKPGTIMISAEEYDRLQERERLAIMAEATPDAFIQQLEILARKNKKE